MSNDGNTWGPDTTFTTGTTVATCTAVPLLTPSTITEAVSVPADLRTRLTDLGRTAPGNDYGAAGGQIDQPRRGMTSEDGDDL